MKMYNNYNDISYNSRERGGVQTSIFDRLFRKKQAKTARTNLILEPSTTISSFRGDAYASDIYRGAVDAIARNAARLRGVHVVTYGERRRVAADARLTRILQTRPNEYMNSFDFMYKMVTHLFLYNNAFALLDWDERGNLAGIYPIDAVHVDMLRDSDGTLYCRFNFKNGSQALFPYSNLIHLRRHFNNDVLLGDGNGALGPALELAYAQNEGIAASIKSSAHIRGILKLTGLTAEAKKKTIRDDFIKNYLQVSNDGGVVVTDEKAEYVPIENHPVILPAEQVEATKAKIYNYLGVSEKIVNSSYSEDEFSAFYESTIEPIATQLSLEFTSKIFNDREQAFGNSILFESGRLQFSSNKTKVQLIKELVPLGILTVNQALEVLNLPSVEDGDRRLQTLNVVDADKALDYQMFRAGGRKRNEGNSDSDD